MKGRGWREIKEISEETIQCVEERFGFKQMTPVQCAAIPLMLSYRDVVAEAVTGSGKTLAFAVAAVELLVRVRKEDKELRGVRVVAISPTRELAQQTLDVLSKLCAVHRFTTSLAVGGSSETKHDEAGHFVVGTPGRLEELFCLGQGPNKDLVSAKKVELLVLDEADTLLDMGFQLQIDAIARALPKQRRTALFSATQTRAVRQLVRAGLRNPAVVSVSSKKDTENKNIMSLPAELESNQYCLVPAETKMAVLLETVQTAKKSLVFFDNCAAVEYFSKALLPVFALNKIQVRGLHGKMNQKRRTLTWEAFAESSDTKACLFCTDVAARGLDAQGVELVIQFDAPKRPETMVHRVGRTARAGKPGRALLLLEENEHNYIELLRLRGLILTEKEDALPTPEASASLNQALQSASAHDRAILELGTTAFISHMKAYQEHQLKYIFRFEALDIGAIARCYGLLRLPKMPEISAARRAGRFIEARDFIKSSLDLSAIPFADPKREAARQRRILLRQDQEEPKKDQQNHASSQPPKPRTDITNVPAVNKKRKGKHAQIMDEWHDLAREERLAKKLRSKRITQQEFDRALLRDDLDCSDDDDTDNEPQHKKAKHLTDLTIQRTRNIRRQLDVAKKRSAHYNNNKKQRTGAAASGRCGSGGKQKKKRGGRR